MMKKTTIGLAVLATTLLCTTSCDQSQKKKEKASVDEKKDATTAYNYSVRIEAAEELNAAPALQSFVHAQNGDDWLLFAGRTNRKADDGGLHDLNGNYASSSFVPLSYNSNLYVYNTANNTTSSLDLGGLTDHLTEAKSLVEKEESDIILNLLLLLEEYKSIFKSSNPQCTQEGEYLYVVGGYGPHFVKGKTDTNNYVTYSQMARLHVPTLIHVIKKEWSKIKLEDWNKLFRFGNHPTFGVTGGEIFKIGNSFYLSGGHNFGQNQVYVMGIHRFQLAYSDANFELNVTSSDTISDINSDSLRVNYKKADSTSQLRRRDCPIVPNLYGSSTNLKQGISFYGGVFKHGDKKLRAWNTAIHIRPDDTQVIDSLPLSEFNMKDQNVYACPDFGIYDNATNTVHTFLPGGIGNGSGDAHLSGFTNTLGHVSYEVSTGNTSFEALPNAFNEQFFGAEAAFFTSPDAKMLKLNGEKSELIHADSTFVTDGEEFLVGYIYGGIHAFEASPTTFGPGKSAATNRIWRVLVKRD